jgi:hypothetical protein
MNELMNDSIKILSDITTYNKYAKYIPELYRRETWEETVLRTISMHVNKYPNLESEIYENFSHTLNKEVLPSMRMLQFAGLPIEINNARGYNCSFAAIDDIRIFSEAMFLLLSGCGFSYSVQKHHIEKLPELVGPSTKKRNYLVEDSIIGWADAVRILIESYYKNKSMPVFDYRDIRAKGSRLITSGGKAPGPQPLKDCIHNIQKILDSALERGRGTKLKTIEAHDIMCFIADAVLSGGIRRAACLAGFSFDDEEMLFCKSGDWYDTNPQRQRANNSVVLLKRKLDKKSFDYIFDIIQKSQFGEPGVVVTNDKDYLYNPCQPSWAKLLTPTGLKEFKDVNIGDKIWSKEGWTTIINKFSTGIKKVYKYQTTAGIFYGTDNHRLLSNGVKVEAKNCESIDSLSGNFEDDFDVNVQDIMDGLVLGDGSVHKASNNLVHLYVGKKDGDYFDSEISQLILDHRPGIKDTAYEISTTITHEELPKTYLRRVPTRYMFDKNKCVGFLRGLFSANGTVIKNIIKLKTASKGLMEDVQLMLNSLGIRSYFTTNKETEVEFSNGVYTCKESYDINITKDRDKFVKIIGFIQKYKNDKISLNVKNKAYKQTYDVIGREYISEEAVFDITVDNNSHTYWTHGCDVSNCGEASLKTETFCNLTTINMSIVKTQEDFNRFARVAAFIGTLQASYTNFHYLRESWKRNTEKDSLIGISMTGLASEHVLNLNFEEAVKHVLDENERVSKLLGINKAARTTLIKPEGTASIVLGCSNGVHSWHSQYYIRRIRLNKDEPLYKYLITEIPELIEDEHFKPKTIGVLSMPVKAPDDAITRDGETAIQLIERCVKLNKEWIQPGHRSGANTHNVSCTISIKDAEWDEVRSYVWENKDFINGMTFFKYDGGEYIQAPFETCTKEVYESMLSKVKSIDLTKVIEEENVIDHKQITACAGGACEVT